MGSGWLGYAEIKITCRLDSPKLLFFLKKSMALSLLLYKKSSKGLWGQGDGRVV